jgi:hypothetical protein
MYPSPAVTGPPAVSSELSGAALPWKSGGYLRDLLAGDQLGGRSRGSPHLAQMTADPRSG